MSWYKTPVIKYKNERKYIIDIETIFKVKNARSQWVQYKLEPHQIEWHLDDVSLKGTKAKHKLVIKSRNTSFTVSSIITILMSVPFYPNQVIPVVRLNQTRANDLINDIKDIIRNMNVIKEKDGSYFPFNPNKVNMDAVGSIKFPNGVEIRGFPATNSAAETIRGLRIAGLAGLIDEANFMKDFESIYIALRDASAGSIDGEKEFQILIGTTRKGRATRFNIWYEEIEKLNLETIKIYKWAVFDPLKIRYDKPLTEQNLEPIVKWHNIYDLEQKRLENINTFKEEYMAELVDGDDQFYETYTINNALTIGEKYNCYHQETPDDTKYYVGIDVSAGINRDYFVISIFEKTGDYYLQRYLYYTKTKELPEMEEFCVNIINKWQPVRVRIDSVGVGTQISQVLVKRFGSIIEPTKGNMSIKGLKRRLPLSLNEYMHTNHKSLMAHNVIGIINDEIQIRHYSAWDNNFKADSGVLGHGDIVIANCLATLPNEWKKGKTIDNIVVVREKDEIEKEGMTLTQPDIDWGD